MMAFCFGFVLGMGVSWLLYEVCLVRPMDRLLAKLAKEAEEEAADFEKGGGQ